MAWLPLGWRCLGVAEIEAFPCAVLARHYPDVTNMGDVLADDFLERVAALKPDVLVGGPPCQDFSVAGLRAGLGGHRGNLTLRWVQIIHASHARFAVTENVPGWLSVNKGHAFGAFIGGLVGHDTALLPPKQCGGRWTDAGMVDGPGGRACWRILDAQFFGLAQRRRRVFVVFCPANGADPAAVLFERKGLRGDPPARREAGQGTAPAPRVGVDGGGGHRSFAIGSHAGANSRPGSANGTDIAEEIAFALKADGQQGVAVAIADTVRSHPRPGSNSLGNVTLADPITTSEGKTYTHEGTTFRTHNLVFGGNNQSGPIDVAAGVNAHPGGRYDFETETFVTHALTGEGFDASEDGTGRGTPLVAAFMENVRSELRTSDVTDALKGAGGKPGQGYQAAVVGSAVRRLTVTECERLQGVPDGYTDVPFRGRPAADGNRYKALGNSFAVPVMRWIGERIEATEPGPAVMPAQAPVSESGAKKGGAIFESGATSPLSRKRAAKAR